MRRFLTRRTNALSVSALSLVMVFLTSPQAQADREHANGPAPVVTPKSNDGVLSSRVSLGGTGYTGGNGTQPITSSNANWSPPDCWYEAFTPDEFEAVLDERYYAAGNRNAGSVYNYLYGVRSDMTAIKYHRGDDGSWWLLVYNRDLPENTAGSCTLSDGWKWVDAGNPPPPGAITAEQLSQVAYAATKLPARKVTLSPGANNQKVNLATYVKFADALPQVYVTAQVPHPPVAATVVAQPYALHVEAGTSYASPQSCDYVFKRVGNQYNIDTEGSGCNITYRKATAAGGAYTLRAQITWKVHWTATADQNGPVAGPMDDGYTTSEQDVTVQEIQAVNR
ncbi:hypothetical protein ACIQCJ_32685 [Streptomyces sp. NPDC093221]|uniref:hypothetical protein n=1 Tax=Streptomyces sp. NPDC093221 TaxID=3366032 RepID=UPI003823FC3C